ncbi:hypothetical protein [Streptosporangium fragile]|uniref:hypothetical protein n=1 Tax=Streptosporangium fragile TaxID=46186 RepID=UPI0031E82D77
MVSEHWRQRVGLLPRQVAFADGVPTACTLARWHDEVVGDTTVAIALRPGQESEVDRGTVADAERDWVAHATPPWIVPGFSGEGFCDPSGAFSSAEPPGCRSAPAPVRMSLVQATVAGFAGPARPPARCSPPWMRPRAR